MGLKFKYTPLSFLKNDDQIKEQIRNTVILKYFYDLNRKTIDLQKLIEGTQYGYNASALELGKNKFLRISDITNGKVEWDRVPFCNCKEESTYLLENEDLLIARTGGTTGKSFLINRPPDKAVFAGYLIRIRANQNSLPDYLNLFLNSYAYWSQVLSLNKGEFRPSVNAIKLKKLQLPDCTIEQQAVARKLSKGESVIGYENLTKRIELALNQFQKGKNLESLFGTQKTLITQLKESILEEAIQGKLTGEWRQENPELITGENSAAALLKKIKNEKARLVKEKKVKKEKPLPPIQKGEIPFELPEGWVWCRLGDVNNIFLGGAAFSSSRFINSSKIQVIRISNVKNDILDLSKSPVFIDEKNGSENSKNELFPKDIIITMTGTRSKQDYCFTVELNDADFYDKRLFLNQRVGCFRLSRFINSTFISNALKFPTLLEPVFNSSTGSANQANISKNALLKILIPLPPLEEQRAIVTKVESLMEKCAALEQEITHSEQHAQMLMQAVLKEAFEGEEKVNFESLV